MKKFTNFTVKSVMDLLIHTNGQTTTLEIKQHLRELGFHANQDDVHDAVEKLFHDEMVIDDTNFDDAQKYSRNTVNSKYNVYFFSDEFTQSFIGAVLTTDSNTTDSNTAASVTMSGTGHVSSTANTVAKSQNAPFTVKNTILDGPTESPTDDASVNILQIVKTVVSAPALTQVHTATSPYREPVQIFYTENHTRKSNVDADSWVVRHSAGNNEIHIYDKRLTRDLVRSKYSSIMKVKIQDVRASRFNNF